MLRTDLLLIQQLFSMSIHHPLYQASPTWPAAATLLRLDANLFGITLLVQKLPRWYHQHIVSFCELSFDPSNFNWLLSGYKLWGEYHRPGLFLSCLPLLLERYLRVIGRSFKKLGNGTLKIGPLSCRQVGRVLRWPRKLTGQGFQEVHLARLLKIAIFLLAPMHPQKLDDGERWSFSDPAFFPPPFTVFAKQQKSFPLGWIPCCEV